MSTWFFAVAVAWGGGPGPDRDTGLLRAPNPQTDCVEGRLFAGEQLTTLPNLLAVPKPNYAWATSTTADVVVTAAEEMAWRIPAAPPLVIGNISAAEGGALDGHKTHREGRDADIGLYFGDRPIRNGLFDLGTDVFNPQANWHLIDALLSTGDVNRILLDREWIRQLRAYLAQERGWTTDDVERIFPAGGWDAKGVVVHADGHRDHMHVRVRCAS